MLTEPIISNIECGDGFWNADCVFQDTAPYFDGHFDGFPVLAGVVQLGMVKHFASKYLACEGEIKVAKKIKFSGVIRPGEKIRLTIRRKGEREVEFTCSKEERICSSGTLSF